MPKENPNPENPGGFLDRLFRPWKKQRVTLTQAGKKQAPMRKGKASARKPKAADPARTTPRQRQVKELQTLLNIGKQNPERLAGIISRLLQEAREKEEAEKLKFEQMVWDKAEKKGESGREEGQ